MIEKELRLALVCRGGLSLAIYIHGIIREIHKLVRASKFYHAEPDVDTRRDLTYSALTKGERRERDTEEVYFDLLKTIGQELDLRVIVDIIGGASAGGINGVMLARAIAHDLPMDTLRERWLTAADVDELSDPDAPDSRWVRWVIKPALHLLPKRFRAGLEMETETGEKISLLSQLRALRPLFSGRRLLEHLYDALDEMGETGTDDETLIPPGLELELFVTVTDFYGYTRHIDLHGQPELEEREHRHILRFRYHQERTGRSVYSEFSDGSVPGLSFSMRATASYPGGFEPATIKEVDELLAGRNIVWENREAFLQIHFRNYYDAGLDPEETVFIDGGVLNNKPFKPVLDAIPHHGAFRQVDRRVIYIDPFPARPFEKPRGEVPGLLQTLKGALSDIPMNEPIYQDLEGIEEHNRMARQARAVIESARPQIMELVDGIAGKKLYKNRKPKRETIRDWRRKANDRAVGEVGFAYESYVRVKLAAVFEDIAILICTVCGYERRSVASNYVAAILMAWAETQDIYAKDPDDPLIKRIMMQRKEWIKFLLSFDARFRSRRLRFVIQRLNELYGRLHEARFESLDARTLDEIKGRLYNALGRFYDYRYEYFLSDKTVGVMRDLFGTGMNYPRNEDEIRTYAPVHARAYRKHISQFLDLLKEDLSLNAVNEEVDGIFAGIGGDDACDQVRGELLSDYLGYAFWDLLLFGLTDLREGMDFDDIRVTRICPDDVQTIRKGGAKVTLKGTALANFGAFFSRRDRENDYLWGRLHGADRLIDIVTHAAELEGADSEITAKALKKRAFLKILETEKDKLPECGPLIESLRKEVEAL